MYRMISSLFAGSVFGLGLMLSGMTDTTKVQGWLDVFGNWDPTLAFVMAGAIVPMMMAWRLTEHRTPVLGGSFPNPANPELGRNLVIGSVLFGMGWGLSGLCPGPAMATLGYGGWPHLLFFAAMVAGMRVAPRFRERLDMIGAKG